MNNYQCIYYEKTKAQTFCECGKPLELWDSRYQMPIVWVENGCYDCHFKAQSLDYQRRKRNQYARKHKDNL